MGLDVGSFGQPRLDHRLNDLHRRAAALAQHRRPCFEVWQQPLGIELNKDELQQRNRALAVGVQEAKVSRAAKTFWQYVLQNQPQKFRAGKAAQLALFGSAVLISKANLAVVMAEDVLLADYAAIQIAAQIDPYFFARSN